MQIFGNTVRFAVYAPPHNMTFFQYAELWRTAEALGYDAAYLTDHLVTAASEPHGIRTPIFEGPTLLSSMASLTTTMRCGINVVGNTFRNPGLAAKVAITLDHVSNGRLELGLGAAHHQIEHTQFEIPFYTTRNRLQMLGESVAIMRSLFENPATNFDGAYYHVHEAVSEPKPIQPRLPIIIGGLGEELTLRIVAEHADIWNVYVMLPPDEYRAKLEVLSHHCDAAGRDPSDVRKSMIVFGVLRADEAEARRAAEARGLPSSSFAGTPGQVVQQLLSYVELGISDFLYFVNTPLDMESVELMANEVAPIVRRVGASLLSAPRSAK